MQCPMPNPEEPDVNRIGTLRTQAIPCNDHGVADCPGPAVHVDGDDRTVMITRDLQQEVALVDLITEASDLLGGAGVTISGLLQYGITL